MTEESIGTAYDVIVIGAGVGGLTAGALMAHAGKRVLIVEENSTPGGFARALITADNHIDPAVHLILGCSPEGPTGAGIVHCVMRHLGIHERCDFIKVEPFYRAKFPDIELDVPSGRGAYIEAHGELFPNDIDGLARLMGLCSRIPEEGDRFPVSPRLSDKLLLPLRYPTLFRHARATAGRIVDRYLSDPKLKALVFALMPYVALPPSRVSFLTWAGMTAGYVDGGAYYCRGGFQQLADALAENFRERGGDLVVNHRVTGIGVEGGRANGITLEDGRTIRAPVIVANIDARDVFHRLIDPDHVPRRYLQNLDALEPSLSTLGLHIRTDLDITALGIPQETVIYRDWDLEQVFRGAMNGEVTGMTVTVPTLSDPSLAPKGEHLVAMMGLLGENEPSLTSAFRQRYAASLLEMAESALPHLRDHITFVAGTGDAEDEFPLLRLGPIYGWAVTPQQSGPFRLPNTPPIGGLFLVGHWAQPAHGISSVICSGVRVARLILQKNIFHGVLPLRL